MICSDQWSIVNEKDLGQIAQALDDGYPADVMTPVSRVKPIVIWEISLKRLA